VSPDGLLGCALMIVAMIAWLGFCAAIDGIGRAWIWARRQFAPRRNSNADLDARMKEIETEWAEKQ